jgi:hypothetical protein
MWRCGMRSTRLFNPRQREWGSFHRRPPALRVAERLRVVSENGVTGRSSNANPNRTENMEMASVAPWRVTSTTAPSGRTLMLRCLMKSTPALKRHAGSVKVRGPAVPVAPRCMRVA